MNVITFLESKKKDTSNQMLSLHFTLCNSYGSWIPLEEFMELPVSTVVDMIEVCEKYNKEKSKVK